MKTIMNKLMLLSLLLIHFFSTTATPLAQVSPRLFLLPLEGGVGVGKKLQMVVMEQGRSGVNPIRRDGILGTWKSSDSSIASVSMRGMVTGIHEGTVTITATVVTQSPRARRVVLRSTVRVGTAVAGLRSPDKISVPHYCTIPIEVQPINSLGQSLDDRPVTWESLSPAVAMIVPLPTTIDIRQGSDIDEERVRKTVDTIFFHRTALVSGLGVGKTLVRVTSEGVTTKIAVDVFPSDATSLRILPGSMELDVQETKQAIVLAQNQQRCPIPNVSVTWATDDPTIATVNSSTGEVRGLKAGATKLTATTQTGLTASIDVTVPAVSFIILDPTVIPELDKGESRQITATLFSASGRSLSHRVVTWSVSDNTVTSLSSGGYTATVTGGTPGTTTVTASSEGVSASLSVTVPGVSFLILDPSGGFELDKGESRQITATPKSASGRSLANRTVTWSTSDNRVATLSPSSGYVTTATGGTLVDANATVQASCEGQSASLTITVPRVSIVSIQPPSLTLSAGGSGQITATPKSSSTKALPSRTVTWRVANSTIASISPSLGPTTTVTGIASGDTTVTASSEGVQSPGARIHVLTYCQTNVCYPKYIVRNFEPFTVYVFVPSAGGWTLVATLPKPPGPNDYWWYLSPDLAEPSWYPVRVWSCNDATKLNCFIREVIIPGGPGSQWAYIDVP